MKHCLEFRSLADNPHRSHRLPAAIRPALGRLGRWILVLAVASSGCGASTTSPDDRPTTEAVQQPPRTSTARGTQSPAAEPAVDVAQDRQTTAPPSQPAPPADEPLSSLIPDDLLGILVIRPQQILARTAEDTFVQGLIERFVADLPADPRTLQRITLLVVPPTPQQLERWTGDSREPIPTEASPEPADERPTAQPTEGPDLDHLFVGLTPEPDDSALEDGIPLPPDPVDYDLTELIPPFVSAVIQFNSTRLATSCLERLSTRFGFADAIYRDHFYLRQSLPRSDQTNPLALYMVDEQTLVTGSEQLLQRMMTVQQPNQQMIAQLRAHQETEHDAWGFVLAPPIRESWQALRKGAQSSGGTASDAISAGDDLLARLASIRFVADLDQQNLLSVSFSAPPTDSGENLTGPIELGISAVQRLIRYWAEISLDDAARGVLNSATRLVGQNELIQDSNRVVLRFKRSNDFAGSWESFRELGGAYARALQSRLHLRRIGVAMLKYADANGRLPDNSTVGIFEHPVSWRIKILPYLGAADVYHQYRIDEPWDSQHNRQFQEQMPRCFGAHAPLTSIMTFTGENTPFPAEPIGLADISDGLDQTLFAVRVAADRAVHWMQPVDLVMDDEDPWSPLGTVADEGLEVVFLDGRVGRLAKGMQPEILWRLIHPRDGKPVDGEH